MTLEERLKKKRVRLNYTIKRKELELTHWESSDSWARATGREIITGSLEAEKTRELGRLRYEREKINLRLRELARRKTTSVPTSSKGPLSRNPLDIHNKSILARMAVIRQTRNLPHRDVCKRLDFDGVQPPESWRRKYNVENWVQAYRNEYCQPLVQKLISTDRRKSQ